MSSWWNKENGIVVSSRVRLARNLSGIPFPSRMSNEQFEELKQKAKSAVYDSNTPFAKTLNFIDMATVPQNEINAMVERHIISPEFAKRGGSSAIILSADESISIMIGEEDHIRIQVILDGLKLEEAYDIAEQIDFLLDSRLHFAFDENLGFLTECPTNLGTGLRASLMLHLPACESSGEIASLSETVNKIGFTVRGMYGEGSKSGASLYQISNQVTLGLSEKEIIDKVKNIVNQIAEHEKDARKKLLENNRVYLEDKLYRAYGTLKYARSVTSKEAKALISDVMMGKNMGIINDVDENLLELLIMTEPAGIEDIEKKQLSPEQRDIKRAQIIRDRM